MLFNSLPFLLFFPVVALLYYLVPPRWRHIWLVVVSYFFYACFAPVYVLLLFFVTLVTYWTGRGIEYARSCTATAQHAARLQRVSNGFGWMLTGLLLCLGVLFFFKYFNFFVGDVLRGGDMEDVEGRIALAQMLKSLPAEERTLILRRYFRCHTQTEIARDMGVSQVQVSRMEHKILNRLRQQLTS